MIAILIALLSLVLPQSPAAVSGLVIDGGAKEPVAGARVLLARVDGPIENSFVVETDDRGRFEARDVPPGRYRVFIVDPRFVRKERTPEIMVSAGQAIALGTIPLVATGVIAGKVVSGLGDPVPGAYVRAWTDKGRVAEARTNDLGDYRLFGLAPGTYVVSAERYTSPRIEGTSYVGPTPPCPDCMGEGAFRQSLASLMTTGAYIDPRAIENRPSSVVYFPGTADRAAAAPVQIEPGAIAGGINLRIGR